LDFSCSLKCFKMLWISLNITVTRSATDIEDSIVSRPQIYPHRAVQWHNIDKLSNDTVPNQIELQSITKLYLFTIELKCSNKLCCTSHGCDRRTLEGWTNGFIIAIYRVYYTAMFVRSRVCHNDQC